ncbi:MAG: DoxX family membrane protein [Myxococcales bacterium]|nr:DoxX family membrane protein [Myxococcales bacterium]MDP3500379.1 DoxX family membrane protein [Myxococcales bacterium]
MRDLGMLLAQGFVGAFLAVLFLQSGLDKVFDWSGNKAYVKGYLEKTPMRPFSGFLFFVITMLEVLAGVVSAAGVLSTVLLRETGLGLFGAFLAASSILSLFMGQRLAKDYASAAAMVPYFLTTLAALVLFGQR